MAVDSRFFVGIGGRFVEIACLNREARLLTCFLFSDLLVHKIDNAPVRSYELAIDPFVQAGLLCVDGMPLQEGGPIYHFAYFLMNEVIEQCIAGNARHHALHAAAVRRGTSCMVLAGNSGAGKSTLTAWLITHGFDYLTDELVLLDGDQLIPFTRPLILKKIAPFLSTYCERYRNLVITARSGTMIPFRLLGGSVNRPYPSRQRITHFLFPTFQEGAAPVLEEISPAQCCLLAMQCHVNARNLERLGVASLAAIIRGCRAYRLIYGDTADLKTFFSDERLSSLFGITGEATPIKPPCRK